MPLFDVPGWTLPSEPAPESQTQTSKKRKRPVSETSRISTAEINFDKLMGKLKGKSGAQNDAAGSSESKSKSKPVKETRPKPTKAKAQEDKKKTISHPKPLMPKEKPSATASASSPRPKKKVKVSHDAPESAQPPAAMEVQPSEKVAAPTETLTSLQKSMREKLDGARFRIINESLYKTDSLEAHQMMRDDPAVFEDYHSGFRHQVQSWPTNPVEHYIKTLSSHPPKTVIADLGCGDAALARALIPKGLNVLSFDLVSNNHLVVEADICAKLPLPGSEGGEGKKELGEGQVVDVVVCALSLMGTNWPGCIREAWRVMRPNGDLLIAEVASRMTDTEQFVSLVGSLGFKLKNKDDRNTHFSLFEFKKIPRKWKNDKEMEKVLARGEILKPCEYKRR